MAHRPYAPEKTKPGRCPRCGGKVVKDRCVKCGHKARPKKYGKSLFPPS